MVKNSYFRCALFLLASFNLFPPGSARAVSPVPASSEITGEITAITSDKVWITGAGITKEYPLAFGVKIICNGITATWKSLIPITSNAFFEAQVSIDDTGRVIMIDGSYCGEECIIQGWFDNAGELNLRLDPVGRGGMRCRTVKKSARLPKEAWLHAGQLVFVVYNRDGQIRGIYLPD